MAKRYLVLNPQGHPAEVDGNRVHIIAYQPPQQELPARWYEGDIFEPPKGMGLDWLLAEGYIKEVPDA